MARDEMDENRLNIEETEAAEQERKPLKGRNALTEGSIRRGIWVLAWPAVLQMSITNINNLIDMFFIGQLNAAASTASVVMASQIGFLIVALMSSVNVGTTALVARFTGARSESEVHETVVQSFTLAAVGSLIIMSIAFAAMRPLTGWMSEDPAVRRQAISYLTITLAFTLPSFVYLTTTAIFRGLGDTLTPLIVIGVTAIVKVGGDYILIFGRGPFSPMGVVGAATATAASQTFGMIIGIAFLLRSPVGHALRGSWRPKTDWMLRILRIGMPAAVQNMVRSGGSWVFFRILSQAVHATAAQAALGIGLQLEGLAFMPGFGFNIAAATLVGQNLGAKKPERAEQAAWGSAAMSAGLMTVLAAMFVIFAQPLAELFSNDPLVQRYVVLYLRINAISEPFLAFSMVMMGAFEGAGDVVPPTVITLMCLWAIRIPCAYLLALVLHYGAIGSWIAMSFSMVLQGSLLALAFRRGHWKHKRI